MPLDIADECHFQVDSSIPRENFTHTVDVVPDGYCGFRVLAHLMLDDENEFPKVKAAMLNELRDNMDIYRHHFHYPVEELQEIIAMGHNYEAAKHGHLPCPQKYWFDAAYCVQLACDTFRVPIAVYTDVRRMVKTTDGEDKEVPFQDPTLYLPYKGPPEGSRPLPLVLHHVHGNHWATVAMKRSKKMIWPKVNFWHYRACKEMGIDDRVKSVWNRFLTFQK